MKLLLAFLIATTAWADWISPKGHTYHPRRDCIALRTAKQLTEISAADAAARGLKPCGICSRWKKK